MSEKLPGTLKIKSSIHSVCKYSQSLSLSYTCQGVSDRAGPHNE